MRPTSSFIAARRSGNDHLIVRLLPLITTNKPFVYKTRLGKPSERCVSASTAFARRNEVYCCELWRFSAAFRGVAQRRQDSAAKRKAPHAPRAEPKYVSNVQSDLAKASLVGRLN